MYVAIVNGYYQSVFIYKTIMTFPHQLQVNGKVNEHKFSLNQSSMGFHIPKSINQNINREQNINFRKLLLNGTF